MTPDRPITHLLGSAAEGGAETYFAELVCALAGAGVPTAALIRPNAGRERRLAEAGAPFRTLSFGGPLDPLTRVRAAGFLREIGARAAVAWMNRAAFHTPRGPWARIGRLGGYYDLKYYRGFDALVGNTADICGWIVEQGWPAERVVHIPNFAAARPGAPASRADHDTPEGAPLLLGMGRLHASKAHDVTLQALAELPGAYLWIAGAGPLEAELKAQAESLGVADRVRWLGWRDDAGALYRAADVCLFPSRYEPLGNVVIQCWAHGTPVIAAASKGPAALIRDGEDGVLVPVDDPAALAAAARALIAAPERRRELAEAGLVRAAAEFSPEAVIGRWRELFERVGGARCAA